MVGRVLLLFLFVCLGVVFFCFVFVFVFCLFVFGLFFGAVLLHFVHVCNAFPLSLSLPPLPPFSLPPPNPPPPPPPPPLTFSLSLSPFLCFPCFTSLRLVGGGGGCIMLCCVVFLFCCCCAVVLCCSNVCFCLHVYFFLSELMYLHGTLLLFFCYHSNIV